MSIPLHRPWFRFWPEGVPTHIEYPEIPLSGFLTDSARRYPSRIALIQGKDKLTYGQLEELSNRFACGLRDLGMKRGDRIMLFLPNIKEYVISYYGILKAGAIVTAASPLFKEMELAYQLNDSGAQWVITTEELHTIVGGCRKSITLRDTIVVGDGAPEGTRSFESLLSSTETYHPESEISPKEGTAVLQYTGGTTGLPRGAMMSHYNLVSNAIQNAQWFSWTYDDVVMAALPFCHTWGTCVCLNSPVHVGAAIVLTPRFDPEEILRTIGRDGVTILYGSATMFNILVNCASMKESTLSSLRLTKAGAMPIPEEVKREWDELTHVELVLGYGLTEASPETHDSPPGRVKPGSVGIPLMDTDAKIVDSEAGRGELPPGEMGELVVKGPQVMGGYWGREEETKEALRGGWLHTGDIARMDEEGYFHIVDRLSDLIKYKGYSVFPAEVENLLYSHPGVKECLVVGRPDPLAGEIPKAFVVPKEGVSITERELLRFCEDRISSYKRVREVEFVSELPKTVTGKPLRRLLRG